MHRQPLRESFKYRSLGYQPECSSVKTINTQQHSRKSSLSNASSSFKERRSSVMLHRRHESLLKITEQNMALLDRINTQKAVVKSRKPEPREKPSIFRIVEYFRNKENVETKTLDLAIAKKKGEIDKILQKTNKTKKGMFYF